MGGGTKVTTQTSEPWEQQIPYLTKGFAGADELLKAGAPAYYQGGTVAGFDPMQTAAQQATMGYAMGPRAAGMQAGAEGALAGTLRGGQAAQNWGGQLARPLTQGGYGSLTPYNQGQYNDLLAGNVRRGPGTPYGQMENALTQGVMSNLQQNILPGIRQQQVQYQPGGSSRANLAQNQAIQKAVQSGLTKPLAEMYGDAYQTAQGMRMPAAQMGVGQQQYGMGYGLQGIGAQQASMGQYPTIMSAPLSMYGAMGDVGEQRRAMSQAGIDADVARYNYEAMAPYQSLANYMGSISGDYGGQSTMTQPGPSGLQTMGQIAGIASMFMSDERLKENITKVGAFNGLNLYEFNYIWSPEKFIGFMAQEVERVVPEAVKELFGYKAVDYALVLGES